MTFASLGSFIPSTAVSDDPIDITVNTTVPVGSIAMLFISHTGTSVAVSGVSDSEGNSWNLETISNSSGSAALAWCVVATELTSSSSTVSVNLASATRCIVRGSAYSGLSGGEISSETKATTGANYNISWDADGDGWAFVVFGFPNDYSFSSDTAAGWTQVFVTDDLTGLQSQQVFRKEVSDGTITCQGSAVSIPYLAVGIVLPFTQAGFGQAVVVV